jgi:transcription factor S
LFLSLTNTALPLKDKSDNYHMRISFGSRRRTREKTETAQEKTSKTNFQKEREIDTVKSAEKTRKPHSFKFCPKCGSTEVFWAQGLPQLWSLWQCNNCGYRGPLILENGTLAEKLQEKWKKQNRPAKP